MATTISQYVKKKRKDMGLTIYDFATRFRISHSLVSQYESGSKDNPSLAVATKFCKVFGISAEDFVANFDYKVFTINDTQDTLLILQHRIDGKMENDGLPSLNRFYSKYSDNNKITDFRIFNNEEKHGIFPNTMSTKPSATCKINGQITCVIYFPYRSIPDNKNDTKLSYYKDYITTINELILHNKLPYENFIILTTDRLAYSFIGELKKAYKKNKKNITIVCNQYKKYSDIMVFSGKRFLFD